MCDQTSPKFILQQMFSEMVVKKDGAQVSHYYHPDFLLFTNGQEQNYESFAEGHAKIYGTPISYRVTYDESTWLESGTKVAVRCWIETQRPEEEAVQYEVLLIASVMEGKIHRLWEVTWPDWSKAPAFNDYLKLGDNERFEQGGRSERP